MTQPDFVRGAKLEQAKETYGVIRLTVDGAHGSGISYVSSWSFDGGLRYGQAIQDAQVYTLTQAEHIISTESKSSSIIRSNIRLDVVPVNYGASVAVKVEQDRTWDHWMNEDDFDMVHFRQAMETKNFFIPHVSALLSAPNQCFVVTHTSRFSLRVVVSYPGHPTPDQFMELSTGNKFGFNEVNMEYHGEGVASYTVFTFTL